MADANRIAAFAVKLLGHFVGQGVNARDRVLERRHPDRSFANRDLATWSGNARFDRGDNLIALRVDTRDGAVPLIDRPYRSFADGEKARPRPDRDCFLDDI